MADDLWRAIQSHRWKHASFMGKIRNRKRRRLHQLKHDVDEMEDENIQSHLPSNRDIEQCLIESLLSPFLDLPVSGYSLIDKEVIANSSIDDIPNTLQKLAAQSLIVLLPDGHSIASVDLDKLSRVAEVSGLTGKVEGLPHFQTDKDEVTWLLNAPSVRDKENRRVGVEIQELLNTKSVKEQLMVERFQSAGGSQLREFCPQKTRENCRRSSGSGRACPRLHFRKIIQSHTDESLGDCSFLNTCFHMESCKFVHYEIDETLETEPHQRTSKRPQPSLQLTGTKLVPPQWINCDLRNFDMSILGKFTVVMADPPWDIHMELPYGNIIVLTFPICIVVTGTMSDDEMRQHTIPTLQDNGYIFLWVTGRAMELGRECLTLWGYERIDEIIWVKTNQLQRLIRTGRTGHWINHGKVRHLNCYWFYSVYCLGTLFSWCEGRT